MFMNEIVVLDNDEPATYKEAMMSPDSEKWLEAMKSEMESMYENQVWTLVDLPKTAARPLRINGSSKERQMLTVMLLSIKLDLSRKVFDKFKELTTTRPSPCSDAKVCPDNVSNSCLFRL